ncbi:amine oxidase [Leucogyrophana mollusca]|uniref:Amine oxidase n=1 Tax=Leucogyrophana mollusca TaxID=85980 RepID=A0ACB8B5T1_9AGAM|nr:amine oxidase [Leucogyrophana mollusca]
MGFSAVLRHAALCGLLSVASFALAQNSAAASSASGKDATVLILGGGVAGVIAARTLYQQGITDFIIVEARDELGGRMQNYTFGAPGKEYTVELGPNWVQGTQTGDGPANPIYLLAQKHNLTTAFNDWYGSISFYDYNGYNNYSDVFNDAVDAYTNATIIAGERVDQQLVDLNLQTGYAIIGAASKTPQEAASVYYQADWTPEETSWIASSWSNNFTYDTDVGGFSDSNEMCIDQRGFKIIIQEEAQEFLEPQQLLLNHTVNKIAYSDTGVTVTTTDGTSLTADYVLCTFSVGVLQYGDVLFEPTLPSWKVEAIQSTVMATYTKIFFQFPENFWFDTEMALYADKQRGRYPVWQSLDIVDFFPGSGIVFVTVTGDFSVRIEALPDEQVQDEVMEVLRAMFPNVTIPEPLDFYFPRWNSNPLFRGSYSNWPASFVGGHWENLRATVADRLWFAGEATSLKYFGFLHGAYFEGLDVAQQMAGCIQGSGCATLQHVQNVMNAQPYPV